MVCLISNFKSVEEVFCFFVFFTISAFGIFLSFSVSQRPCCSNDITEIFNLSVVRLTRPPRDLKDVQKLSRSHILTKHITYRGRIHGANRFYFIFITKSHQLLLQQIQYPLQSMKEAHLKLPFKDTTLSKITEKGM